MIERIVEDWVTSSTERVYEIPFCQLLAAKGYRLIHKTTHGPTEQGKDIITRDANGTPCAFQLKTGEIKTRQWREMSGEISELIELAIDHPNVRPSEKHRAVLVTNQGFSDDVRTKITNLNRANRRRNLPMLETLTGPELVADFLKHFGSYLPRTPEDFRLFLRLYLGDGTENIPEESLSRFLGSLMLSNTPGHLSARAKRELAASGLVMTTYALKPYSESRNHLAVAQGYSLFASYLLAAAEKLNMTTAQWSTSFDLSWAAIDRESQDLKEEALAKKGDLFEGDLFGDGGLVYRIRAVVLLGWLSGIEIARKMKNPEYRLDTSLVDMIRSEKIVFFGEFATIHFVLMSIYAELAGDRTLCESTLADILAALAAANSGRNKNLRPFPDPYWRPEAIIENFYGITDPRDSTDKMDFESFRGCAFTVTCLIGALARRGIRAPVDTAWRDLSYLQHAHFIPQSRWETYLWRSKRGTEKNTAFPITGSWARLRKDAIAKSKAIPPLLKAMPWFIPIFLLTYPHRTNDGLLRLVDPAYAAGTKQEKRKG